MVKFIFVGSFVVSSILGAALLGVLIWWLMKRFKWGPYKEKLGAGSRTWLTMLGTGENYNSKLRVPSDNFMYRRLVLSNQ